MAVGEMLMVAATITGKRQLDNTFVVAFEHTNSSPRAALKNVTRHTSHVTSQFTRHLTDVLYMISWPKPESMFKRCRSHVARHKPPYAAAIVSSCEDVTGCCDQQLHNTHRRVTKHPSNGRFSRSKSTCKRYDGG